MTSRVLQPELLETYPNDHPVAIRGRRDLLIVNAVMGNHRWMVKTLRRCYRPGWQITELGAGDGALSLRLLKAGLCEAKDLHGLDLVGRPSHWPADAAWSQGDLLAQPLPESQVLIANLLLHHFTDDQLRALGRRLPESTRVIIAAEPARSPFHAVLGKALCYAAGFHQITHYDMQVSIRAGFRGRELAEALGLGDEWQIRAGAHLFGGYRFLAVRQQIFTNYPSIIHRILTFFCE